MEIRNDNGIFRFDVRARRWLCVLPMEGSEFRLSANCFVPLCMGTMLNKQARAEGYKDLDFGIRPKKVKVKRASTGAGGKKRSRSKVRGVVLFDFGE